MTSTVSYRSVDFTVPTVFHAPTWFDGGPYNMPFIVFRTQGCRFAQKKKPCVMCAYDWEAMTGTQKEDETALLTEQIRLAKTLLGRLRPPLLAATPIGSFFDSKEWPSDIWEDLLTWMGKQLWLKRLQVESRPEHILSGEGKVRLACNLLRHVGLSVGIGVESWDEKLRQSLGKDIGNKQILDAVGMLKGLGVDWTSYLFFGIPGLDADQIVESMVNSIERSFEKGAAEVVIMTPRLYPGTPLVASEGTYIAPHIQSLVDVLRSVTAKGHQQRVHIVLDDVWPVVERPVAQESLSLPVDRPVLALRGCGQCLGPSISLLKSWSLSRDVLFLDMIDSIRGSSRGEPCCQS